MGSASGPELPMQVVQPSPTRWKPRVSRSCIKPALVRYSVTTFDPGAMLVLTQGLRLRPRWTALRASSPAPIMTDGLDVLVQLVMAATTTEPSLNWKRVPSYSHSAVAATSGAAATAVAGDWPPSPAHRAPSFSPTARRALGSRLEST